MNAEISNAFRNKFKIAFFCLFFLLTSSVYAQNDTIKLADIYVQANFSKKIFADDIDSSFVRQNSMLRLADVLKSSNSVFVKSFGDYGVSTVSFRGTSATHTQVFWNDTPLNSSMLGQTDFSIIPVFVADKISVSAGIKSLANSAGALGGIINLATVPDYSKNFAFDFFSSANSMRNFSSGINLKLRHKSLFSDTKIFTSLNQNRFEYLNTAIPPSKTEFLQNADTKQITFIQQFFYNFNSTNRLSAYVWLLKSDRNIPPIMSFEGLYRTENQLDARIIAGLKFTRQQRKLSLKNNFSVYNYGLDYFLADSVISMPENEQIVKTNAHSNELSFNNLFDVNYKIDSIFKVDFSLRSNFVSVSTYDSAEYSQNGYRQTRWDNQFNVIFLYQLRKYTFIAVNFTEIIENTKFQKPAFFVSLSDEKLKRKGIFFDINAGRNVHIPTLNDLYWQPGGNPDLKPEFGWSGDISTGLKFTGKNINFYGKFTTFASLINDWILWRPTEFHYWQAMNVKQVFSRGFNTKISFEQKGEISYKFITNYAFTKSTSQQTYDSLDVSVGKQLIYTPLHALTEKIIFRWNKYEFSADFVFTSKQFTNTANFNLFTIPAYSLINLSLAKKFVWQKKHIINISLYINNVLDRQYQTVLFRPMPGRNFGISLKVKY